MAFYTIALSIVVLDHSTKWAAVHLAQGGPALGDLVRLTLTYNTGAAFGLFPGARGPFVVISAMAAAGLIYAHHVLPRSEHRRRLPMALILGGILGNLVDRVRLGQVTDFIDMGIGDLRWPTYNVADIAVVVGVVTLATRLVVEMLHERRARLAVSARESADLG